VDSLFDVGVAAFKVGRALCGFDISVAEKKRKYIDILEGYVKTSVFIPPLNQNNPSGISSVRPKAHLDSCTFFNPSTVA